MSHDSKRNSAGIPGSHRESPTSEGPGKGVGWGEHRQKGTLGREKVVLPTQR